VEYDGVDDGLFSFRRRNRKKQWIVFTRGLADKLLSFVVFGRSTYTAATRHLAADVSSFHLRRQDVVKLGTAVARSFTIPQETARCPICGPNPKFIVIDAQALGCTDPDDTHPFRPGEDCPVLPIDASLLCVVKEAALRGAIDKVLSGAKDLTAKQIEMLRSWAQPRARRRLPTVEAAAAYVFFNFFPIGSVAPPPSAGEPAAKKAVVINDRAAAADVKVVGPPTIAAQAWDASDVNAPEKRVGLQAALRRDEEGNLVLGGPGKPATAPLDTWRDRVGVCAPNFDVYPRDDDRSWLSAVPFLKAVLSESVTGMFQGHDERAVKLLADALKVQGRDAWREVNKAVDGVGFVASFLGSFGDEIDADPTFRVAVGTVLRHVVDVEEWTDEEFKKVADSEVVKARGWKNADYCARWGATPTPADFAAWRRQQPAYNVADIDDPLISYEFFAGLMRVRPALRDSVAALRRSQYHGKKRHAADMEGVGDACNKAFSVTAGLTQGVFNVVCPHVVTLGFRCLFKAESVGEALSIVLERFPRLPEVIFYDVACKIDKNALRRVRTIMRGHGVRCILDRAHAITHTCSPVYMPDQSLGNTAGVATQAAEVFHSVSVGNRTSLAYMTPTTYMTHRMIQVAHTNLRKLARLHSKNPKGEMDHVRLNSFFHSRVSRRCERGDTCKCGGAVSGGKLAMARMVLGPSAVQGRDGRRSLGGAQLEALGGGSGDVGSIHGAAVAIGLEGDPPPPSVSGVASENGSVPGTRSPLQVASTASSSSTSCDEFCPADNVDAGRRSGVVVDDSGSDDAMPSPQAPAEAAVEVDGLFQKKAGLLFGDGLAALPLSPEQASFLVELVDERAGDLSVQPVNKAGINLTVADYNILFGNHWLNDEIMNSYGGMMNDRDDKQQLWRGEEGPLPSASVPVTRTSRPRRTRVMSTHFYDVLNRPVWGYDFLGVSRWGIKAGIKWDKVDAVVVPINERRSHWVLVVVDVEARRIVYCDSFLGGDSCGAVSIVQRWVHDDVVHQLGAPAAERLDVASWPVVEAAVPRQNDSCSCGLFALMVANSFAMRSPLAFSQEDMPAIRQRLTVDLLLDRIEWTTEEAVVAARSLA